MKKIAFLAVAAAVLSVSCKKQVDQPVRDPKQTQEQVIYFRVQADGATTDYSTIPWINM